MEERNVSRRRFLEATAWGAGALALGGFSTLWGSERLSPPNVLLIMVDQLSGKALSAHGNPYVSTPNIDSMIDQGVSFSESYCVAPVCTPSRHGLLTSLIPEQTQVKYNRDGSRRPIPNAGQVFSEAGYRTAWAGKWHIGRNYPRGGRVPGFDYLATGVKGEVGLKVDDPVADAAVNFLAQTHNAPFFLGVSFQNPHDICFWIRGEDLAIPDAGPDSLPPLPDNFQPAQGEPEFIGRCRGRKYYGDETRLAGDWDNLKWREYLHVYYSLVERVDGAVGRVLTALRRRDLEENTLGVFTSDHGDGLAAHKWAAKLMFYEECVKVPLVFRWMGVIPSRGVGRDHLASGLDILPTVCDYAGVEAPGHVQGVSLRAVIDEPRLTGREFVVAEVRPEPMKREFQGRMLRTHEYKYIAFSWGRDPEMLFDLADDPGETTNLARRPDMQDTLQRHRDLLADWIKAKGDAFTLPHLKKEQSQTSG